MASASATAGATAASATGGTAGHASESRQRTLHLVDIENLMGDVVPGPDRADVALAALDA